MYRPNGFFMRLSLTCERHCYFCCDSFNLGNPGEMPWPIAERAIEQANQLHIKEFMAYGGNIKDPNGVLRKVLEKAHYWFQDRTLASDGKAFAEQGESLVKKIAKAGVGTLQLSIHEGEGDREEIYEAIRGVAKFNKTHVARFQEAQRKSDKAYVLELNRERHLPRLVLIYTGRLGSPNFDAEPNRTHNDIVHILGEEGVHIDSTKGGREETSINYGEGSHIEISRSPIGPGGKAAVFSPAFFQPLVELGIIGNACRAFADGPTLQFVSTEEQTLVPCCSTYIEDSPNLALPVNQGFKLEELFSTFDSMTALKSFATKQLRGLGEIAKSVGIDTSNFFSICQLCNLVYSDNEILEAFEAELVKL